jgi:hypothetical protein
MAAKKRYVVNFFKTVSTSFGEDREVRQGSIEVFADEEADALAQAKVELCRQQGVSDWRQRADRWTIEQPDFPS